MSRAYPETMAQRQTSKSETMLQETLSRGFSVAEHFAQPQPQ